MENDKKSTIKSYLKMCDEELKASKICIENNLFRQSISNSYYAMYNAACILVVLDDLIPSKHKMVISHVNKEYCKDNHILPQHYGRLLKKAEEARNESDYDPSFIADKELAVSWYTSANEYVNTIKTYLES